MNTDIHCCRQDELASLLSLTDAEFIFAKHRRRSLAERFPAVYSPANLSNIYVARRDGCLAASATVKRFVWHAADHCWQGAMIGAVYTHPNFRKQGLGSAVMQKMQDDLAASGVDFGVLWTGIPGFYERLGWHTEDIGLFGEGPSLSDSLSINRIVPCPLTESMAGRLDSVRCRSEVEYMDRQPTDYAAIPLPANTVDLFWLDQPEGYALVGRSGATGYLYEAYGGSDAWEILWHSLRRSCETLYLNQRDGAPFQKWLAQRNLAKWTLQHMAMWLPFSAAAGQAEIGRWYVPYFDRI